MKVRFFNLIFLIFIFIGVGAFGNQPRYVEADEIEFRNERAYIKNESMPFSGIVIERYITGEIKVKYEIENGLEHGEVVEYYKSGKIKEKNRYEMGEKKTISRDEKIAIIVAVILLSILPISIIKIFTSFPKIKFLEDDKKEEILDIFVKYNENIKSLHSANSINGTGTSYFKISKFTLDGEKIFIYAKMYSALWVPMPYVLGYLTCYDKDKIISSVSRRNFK